MCIASRTRSPSTWRTGSFRPAGAGAPKACGTSIGISRRSSTRSTARCRSSARPIRATPSGSRRRRAGWRTGTIPPRRRRTTTGRRIRRAAAGPAICGAGSPARRSARGIARAGVDDVPAVLRVVRELGSALVVPARCRHGAWRDSRSRRRGRRRWADSGSSAGSGPFRCARSPKASRPTRAHAAAARVGRVVGADGRERSVAARGAVLPRAHRRGAAARRHPARSRSCGPTCRRRWRR